jgi:hypothetical protein
LSHRKIGKSAKTKGRGQALKILFLKSSLSLTAEKIIIIPFLVGWQAHFFCKGGSMPLSIRRPCFLK